MEGQTMISILFFILAAISNSIMDVTQFHFYESVFNNGTFKLNWWSGVSSWKNKYVDREVANGRRKVMGSAINYPVQLTDAFHFFKMLMIVFLALAVITFDANLIKFTNMQWLNLLIALVAYGTLWNCTFSLFYNKILRK
jgi:hypothetical protein